MATDKKLSSLVINTLTQAQYDSATKNEDELYLTPDDTDEQLANKQDKLVSGTNIKTVNGNSLLGSGNIEISGGSGDSSIGTIELTASQAEELSNLKITLTSDNAVTIKSHSIVQLTYNTIVLASVFVSLYNNYYTIYTTFQKNLDEIVILSSTFNSNNEFPRIIYFGIYPVTNLGWSLNASENTNYNDVQLMKGDGGTGLYISKTINGHLLSSSSPNVKPIQFYEHNIYMLYESGDTTFCIRFAFVNNVSDTYTSVSALQGYLGTNFVKGCSGYMTSSAGYGNAYSVTYNKVTGIVGTSQASITYSDTGLTITDTIKEMS